MCVEDRRGEGVHFHVLCVVPSRRAELSGKLQFLVWLSLVCNICLCAIKLTAAILSSSYALIASSLDSFLDVISGGLLYFTGRAVSFWARG